MADNRIAVQDVTLTGVTPTYAVAGAGAGALNVTDNYQINNDGNVMLHFKKSGAGACTVTFDTPGTVDGVAIANPTLTVPATTGDKMIGPFRASLFNDPNHDLRLTVSDVTGLTLAVVKLPRA